MTEIPSRQRRGRHPQIPVKLVVLKKWREVIALWDKLRPRSCVVRFRIFQAEASDRNSEGFFVNEKHHDRTPLDRVNALQSVSTVSPLHSGLTKLRSSGHGVKPSPETREVGTRYLNTVDGKIYILVSEEDGLVTFKREGRETLRYLSSAEFHNRFFTQEEMR